MADQYVQLQTDGSGKKIDVSELTVNAQTVERQRITIGDNTTAGNYAGVTSGGALKVDGSAVTQPVSGTFWQATQPVSASALPLPSGAATSAKQPALGTAGSASSDVLSVQGVASMTALKVDGSAVTQPVSGTVSCNTHAVTQSGTWTVQPGNTPNTTPWLVTSQPSTSGGLTPARLISAATTNATSLKTSAGQLYNLQAFNLSASNKFVKFYNKASAPTVGSDTPVQTYLVPPGGGIALEWSNGLAFGTGIAYAITGAYTDADTTAVAAGDVLLNLGYK